MGTVGVVVGLIASMLIMGGADATPTALAANFELDGNATNASNPDVAPPDWEALAAGDVPTGWDFTGIVPDKTVKTGDVTMFTGGGSKDGIDVPSWAFKPDGGLPAKDDITDAYATAMRNSSSEKVVYFGADRFDNSGDAQIGFWFFQASVGTPATATSGGFTGQHTQPNCRMQAPNAGLPLCSANPDPDVPVGDILVLSDFTNGGQVSTINVYEWVGTSGAPASDGKINRVYPNATTIVDCGVDNASGTVCGTVNKGSALIDSPWPYVNKSKQGQKFAKGEFYEGGINLGLLFPGTNPCFASFLAETRSSSSPTAVLKDFVGGGFEPCTPSTTMAATTPTVSPNPAKAGDDVTFTFYEKNDGQVDLSNVSISEETTNCTSIGGVLQSADDPSTSVDETTLNVGDVNGDGRLNKGESGDGDGEEWTFECVAQFSTAGAGQAVTVVGHGYADGVDITYPGDPEERATATVDIINPSTKLRQTAEASVTYTYYETNDGDSDISSPYVNSDCSGTGNAASKNNLTNDPNTSRDERNFNVGDTNFDSKLNVGETWTFTCTETVSITSGNTVSRTDNGTGHGVDATGAVHDNTTDPGEADSSTVTITNNTPND